MTNTKGKLLYEKESYLDTKQFIAGFDFPNPDWSNLPVGFPNLDKKGLTTEEKHLLDGIKLAWIASEGRGIFYKQLARKTLVVAVIVFTVLLGRIVLTSTSLSITQTVSAKTVGEKVGNLVEATMSAVFRQ